MYRFVTLFLDPEMEGSPEIDDSAELLTPKQPSFGSPALGGNGQGGVKVNYSYSRSKVCINGKCMVKTCVDGVCTTEEN